jgi:hypothetical protein
MIATFICFYWNTAPGAQKATTAMPPILHDKFILVVKQPRNKINPNI